MSHAIKLMVFFIISVALHGAGLWAAAGRYEPHEPDIPAGVEIVDRSLFFRHAERISTQASNPVSATDRITPRSASTVQPSQPGDSVAPAPAEAAGEAELERRAPASPLGAMARLDPSIVEPAPPSRREASAHRPDAERREPVRMSAVDATAPPAAAQPKAQRSVLTSAPARTSEALAPAGTARQASLVIAPPLRPSGDLRQAARAPAPEPVNEPDSRRIRRSLQAAAPVHAAPPEPLARTAADPAMHGTAGTIDRAATASLQANAPAPAAMAQVERSEPETAQARFAVAAPRLAPPATRAPADLAAPRLAPPATRAPADLAAPRLAPPATRAPADLAAREEIAPRPADRPVAPEPVTEAASVTAAAPTVDATYATAAAATAVTPADAPAATAAVPAQAPRDRPELRGTLPAPLLAARQPQTARLADAPTAAPLPPRRQAEALRLRPSLPDDTAPERTTLAAAPPEAPPARPSTAQPSTAQPSTAQPSAVQPSAAPPPAPAPVPRAAPQELAALAPQTPARRLESPDPPSGRNDPADRFTRAYQGGECFFPLRLASRDGASRDGAAIRGYGVQAESVDMFRQAFAQALGREPDVDWRPLTDAQCAGISFTRLVLGDSAPSVAIALERKELGLGHNLTGRLAGNRLEFVTLLVVDDSGVVHNVLDHLTPEAADLAFDIPVQPVDDGTDKVQLVMAVGASRPLPILESTTPVHSDDFFPALRDQAVDTGAVLELGLEDFVILGGGS